MPPANPVMRAVFFDAGNTLLRMNYAVIAAELGGHGFHVTPDAVQRAEWRARVRLDDEVLSRSGPGDSTENRSTAERYLSYLLDGLGVTDPVIVGQIVAWRRAYNPPVGVWNSLDPDAAQALAAVRRAGLRAAVISNSNGSVRSILESFGLAGHLDFVVDSAEEGVEKPDPRIFELALARARVAPGEAVYIGDLYSIDVRGARAAGMRAVLLDPGGHWGSRDCPMVPDLPGAVRVVLAWR
jgi:HAD superfamily hydrolase (TIGR01509 family)